MSGTLFIVAAPSGAGKTTLVAGLLSRDAHVRLSISHTTRAPRPAEVDGRDYHFVGVEQFEAMRERGEFLEWALVHGNFYATSRHWLEKEMDAGRDIILEIDWQGARQVRAAFPAAIGIFVLPPALEDLEKRLRGRAQDSEAVIARRIAAAKDEMRHVGEFDYVIINNELHEAIEDFGAIVRASRLRLGTQSARHRHHFAFSTQD